MTEPPPADASPETPAQPNPLPAPAAPWPSAAIGSKPGMLVLVLGSAVFGLGFVWRLASAFFVTIPFWRAAPWSRLLVHLALAAGFAVVAVVTWTTSRRRPATGQDRAPAAAGLVLGGLAVWWFYAPAIIGAALLTWSQSRGGGTTAGLANATILGAALPLAAAGAYAVWAFIFAQRHFPAHSAVSGPGSGPGAPQAWPGAPSLPWADTGLKVALTLVGILVTAVAVMFGILVAVAASFGHEGRSCVGVCRPASALLPFAMVVVPVAYLFGSLAFVRARARRASRDPVWAARAQRGGSVFAIVAVVFLLSAFALVVSCFGFAFLASSA